LQNTSGALALFILILAGAGRTAPLVVFVSLLLIRAVSALLLLLGLILTPLVGSCQCSFRLPLLFVPPASN
jgi:hypothetical protein